jgi:hypothetical protein
MSDLLLSTRYFLLPTMASLVAYLQSSAPLMAFSFEILLVHQKAVDFADRLCDKTEKFGRGYAFLVNQLNRAALSVSANIAEGNDRFTKADRRNFFTIARG